VKSDRGLIDVISWVRLEGEEIVDAPGKNDNASMSEQVQRPNPWSKMILGREVLRKTTKIVSRDSCCSSRGLKSTVP
jgi:hypothetical protein